MPVYVGIHLPRLSLEVFRPRWSRRPEHGCVVLDHDKVLIADPGAREAGVCLGMKRGGVLTLAPDTLMFERDLVKEQDVMREAAFSLMKFSPMVALCDEETIVVDVTASLRLFGGIVKLCQQMRDIVDAIGLSARVSTSPTGQGAWLLAKSAGRAHIRRRVLKMASLERKLGALPFQSVQEVRAFADWFSGLGCKTLNDIRRLPRAGLKKRCGVALLDSLDRAYGIAPELYEWLAVPPAFSARIELPDRIENAEAMLFSARRLIVQMCGWLSTQQLALTHATLTLEHERGRSAIDPTIIQIALAEPTWHEQHLVRLFKERLGRTELVAAVIAMRLSAAKIQAAEPPTETLFPEPGGSPEDHNRLLELLVARLGAENVLRAAPSSDHRPECANRWISVTDTSLPAKPEGMPSDLPRPAWLLEKPLQLMMKNHRPFYGSPLKTVSPAERIEAGWFDNNLTSRDYFVAQANDQSCYWIYRERPGSAEADDPRWFLHGLFG
ncbi:MAG: DNA polymerase Y family protein [Pseudomonadota bacterium]|jgi:protein ImuB|uniref:Y-family DNA polymerase n=2 Tax=Burkholderiales TaxID=80840 RepID=UPI00076AFE2F|nr:MULTISPECIES: DNA polymerase Y family protein [Burkholderiaceae]AMH42890.1 DNA polymerase [Burkholderia sp. PAMC 26561]AMM16143.1 DNA polymerase [Burkholderia sp. PAMC 28687]MDP9152769.1 DNA polymerase Y family protein [Pseudomonadota bacterium]